MFDWRSNSQTICDAPLTFVDVGALDTAHPALAFLAYWNSLNKGNTPDRKQFSPKDIPSLLRWLMMFRREMRDGSDDYLLYLQGNSAAEQTHGLLQGQYLTEFTAANCFETRREVMRHVLNARTPAYAKIDASVGGCEFSAKVTVGAFPMTDGDKEPQVIMVPAPYSLELRMYL